ncbi:MAG: hypothetical protein IT454_19020 [Planctomycetes bacterium]|nr:hypothetical protein [Planctomycetota bacterium]
MKQLLVALAVCVALGGSMLASAQDGKPASGERPAGQKVQETKPAADPNQGLIDFQSACYPLKKCVISGEELGKNAINHVVDGRLVRVCCKDCVAAVEKDKSAAFKKIDAAVIEQQLARYPLEKCPISGEKLGEKAVNYVHGTRLIRACCNDCVAEIKKNAEPTLKKLGDAYIAAQKASYPLETCVVTGETIGKDPNMQPVDFLYGTRYFRLCCAGCKKAVTKDSDGMWAKVEAARAAKK